MVKQIGGQKRKTARILALEAYKKAKKQNDNDTTDKNKGKNDPSFQQQQPREVAVAEHNAAPAPPSTGASSSRKPVSETRKSSKMKRLDEVTNTSTLQDEENRRSEDPALNSVLRPSQQLPEKNILEGVLDILQLRDTHEIFAQPVDPKEVVDYYDFIKEPMDFGTMRAKLQEGLYSTLQQFENDVFLIFNNAMRFNSSATIYFRQACVIHELATRVFPVLKTDPKKFEHEFLLTRKRPGQKPRGQIASSRSKSAAKHRGNKAYPGLPSSNPSDDGILPGSRDGRKVNLCKTDRRQTYHPPDSVLSKKDSIVAEVYNSSTQLVPGNRGIGYKESLLRFVKDLGPMAQMVACRKLQYLTQKTPINSVHNSRDLISLPAAQHGRSCTDGVIKSIFAGANDQLCIGDPVSKGKSVPISGSIGTKDTAHRGKIAFGIGGLGIHGADSKGMRILTGDSMDSKDGASGERTALARGMMNFQGATEKEMFPHGDTMGICNPFQREKAHGKAIDKGPSGDMAANQRGLSGTSGPFSGMIQPRHKLDLLPSVREDSASQSKKGKSWLGFEFSADGSESLNGPMAGITNVSGKYNIGQLLGAIRGENAHLNRTAQNKRPFHLPSGETANNNNESARMTDTHRSKSRLTEFLHSGNRYPKSCVYPSKVVKPSSSQASTFFPGFVSHSSVGMKQPNAPLDLNYGASSSQVNQASEQSMSKSRGPLVIYDYPNIQPQHVELNLWGKGGLMQQESQPKAGQYVQPPSPSEVNLNPLGQGAFWQQQQQQPNDVNLGGQVLCPRKEFQVTSGAYMQPQLGLLNLLNHNVFVQPEVELHEGTFLHPPPNDVNNPLGPDTYRLQGPQYGLSQYLQPLRGGVNPFGEEVVLPQETLFGLPPQGLMFDAGNFWEGAPSQSHQSISNAHDWNSSQQQALRDSQNPELALGLNTENRRL